MTSTMRSAASNSMSKMKTGSCPAVRATPATSSASGAVTLYRASRPAISAQPSSSSKMTTSASIGPPADEPAGVSHPVGPRRNEREDSLSGRLAP